ncbi:homocysteine methyltransferase [Caproiciproducens sp. NJN-50]|uniref:homocysteine S-methyltransferase family protein n=1 Tax=Acutalibacteraceae TaxID=3082771 RepID=UPI000FFE3244|nr:MULTISPECIES: homocysteine S-methyltransferase family protein [Acutalibacteraceae]QAT49623.1 homocysteine methyltransferase [Caproiciproducens sp. NJN-50]
MNLKHDLGRRMVFFDGGMGTLLQANGLGVGELPELWNLQRPELIESIHRRYLEAGADLIKTNTFGANRIKLRDSGRGVEEIISAAVRLAKKATAGTEALVAMDIGPTGKLMKPVGDLEFEDAVSVFAEAAMAGEQAGADLILIETMGDTLECKAAVLAAKENTSLPVFATVIVDEAGRLLTGGDIPAFAALLEGLGADALGLNCGFGPDQMKRLLPGLLECCSIPVIVNPNAGLPRVVDGQNVYDVTPDEFAADMKEMAESGAWIIGGCCGTTPDYIRAMTRLCRDIVPKPIGKKSLTVISSYSRAVVFGRRPVLIGERINPTGKKRLKQALRENDMDYLMREAVTQQSNGAQVLDVNVGLPELDETEVLSRAVREIQGVTDLPLQIDTSSVKAMASAMRVYNGKPLVNSVNGKEESMRSVFPLIRKYGGVAIALTLDESGIPETAEGRFAVAEKILRTAEEYGLGKKDLVFDPLAMTISAGQQNARVTLESLRLIRGRLGAYTSLGVSNISFGLPGRERINAAFFVMAMQNGLGAAILNPGSAAMMDAYYAFCALSGADDRCLDYIGRYSGQEERKPALPPGGDLPLQESIRRGLKDSARSAVTALLERREPLEIINSEMIPALDQVGKEFEKGTLFLPQLLMSAEAAKSAFEILREKMSESGQTEKKGRVILATVKGDIHDIGKNIVKVLLENYGFDVLDLGRDVAPEKVVEAAAGQRVRLVGLSALMTTTVVSMEETIRQLHLAAPDCKVMVGGAVLTQEYADRIHADFYSPDAMGSVRYAQKVFS